MVCWPSTLQSWRIAVCSCLEKASDTQRLVGDTSSSHHDEHAFAFVSLLVSLGTSPPVIADVQEIIGNITQGAVTEITRMVEEKVVGETREMLKGEFAQLREALRAVADWQMTRPTYASMTARVTSVGTEREHQAAMAKGTLQRRQVLPDGIEGVRTAVSGLT